MPVSNFIPVPDTVGDLIKILKKFPADYNLDLFKREIDCYGGTNDANVFSIEVIPQNSSKSLEITFN
jgi:hypothetical protein